MDNTQIDCGLCGWNYFIEIFYEIFYISFSNIDKSSYDVAHYFSAGQLEKKLSLVVWLFSFSCILINYPEEKIQMIKNIFFD
jgi:hypothetical protein